jgi:hypothetical protein
VTRRELKAVVASIKHFHHYLYGKHFKVRSDHGALSWLLPKKLLTSLIFLGIGQSLTA